MKIFRSLYQCMTGNAVIIRYQGGLGNQMFQYAFKIAREEQGDKVYDDLSFYGNKRYMPLVIDQVFPNVRIRNFLSLKFVTKVIRKFIKRTKIYFVEENYTLFSQEALIATGWFEGYWQSYKYYEKIRSQLIDCFRFQPIDSSIVKKMKEDISARNSVSIHVRAGDYLKSENAVNFGGICTIDYYLKAIEFIKNNIQSPIFYIFTDDIKWCRENIMIEEAIYVTNKGIDGYQDWMDMYLMSICKHNIIANSSFSWWAAWLNLNDSKIVICPQKWTRKYDNIEVCPQNWIRI